MKSGYILELSVTPGGARYAEGHAYGDLDSIGRRLASALGIRSPDGADPFVAGLALRSAVLAVWVVERGRITEVVDLRPLLTIDFDGGRSARLDDEAALAPLRESFDRDPAQRVRFTLGPPPLAAAVPPIASPLLAEGDYIDSEVAPELLDKVPSSYFAAGIEMEYGSWDLEDGSAIEGDDVDEDE